MNQRSALSTVPAGGVVPGAVNPRRGGGSVRAEVGVEALAEGIGSGERAMLGRGITLVEGRRADQQRAAQELLVKLLPKTGKAQRIGITGVPGAGKSTFIENFGRMLTGQGLRVAVLAIDPTSTRTGGSILGDKTRMAELANDPLAFVRPSPSCGTLGGVARKTREAMLLCEAAGFDVILVETVGVGQTEVVVAGMVDFLLVLALAGAGDELQGIKRGVLEIADMIAINKADGDNAPKAKKAARQYENALHFMRPTSPNWTTPVVTCSALKREGLGEIWGLMGEHREKLTASGELEEKRRGQMLEWMWGMIEERLMRDFREHEAVRGMMKAVEGDVLSGRLTPALGAEQLIGGFER